MNIRDMAFRLPITKSIFHSLLFLAVTFEQQPDGAWQSRRGAQELWVQAHCFFTNAVIYFNNNKPKKTAESLKKGKLIIDSALQMFCSWRSQTNPMCHNPSVIYTLYIHLIQNQPLSILIICQISYTSKGYGTSNLLWCSAAVR